MFSYFSFGRFVPFRILNGLCDILRETNIRRKYSMRDTLMSPGRRAVSALVDLVYCQPLVTGSKPNAKSTPAKDSLCVIFILFFCGALFLIFL